MTPDVAIGLVGMWVFGAMVGWVVRAATHQTDEKVIIPPRARTILHVRSAVPLTQDARKRMHEQFSAVLANVPEIVRVLVTDDTFRLEVVNLKPGTSELIVQEQRVSGVDVDAVIRSIRASASRDPFGRPRRDDADGGVR